MKIVRANAKITLVVNKYNLNAILENGSEIKVSISPSMKQYKGKDLKEGDNIIVQASPFDLTVGRLHRDTFLYLKDG